MKLALCPTKYFHLLLCGFLLLSSQASFSQTLSAAKLIEEFNADDVYQTKRFDDVFADLVANLDGKVFDSRSSVLQNYLSTHKNPRVKVRTFLYERHAFRELGRMDSQNSSKHYFEMIKMASSLDDEQLLSELYFKYALLCAQHEKLYYLLKCIEIRERIGVKYFLDIAANYYWASQLLYGVSDYEGSARYAARCVALHSDKGRRDYFLLYILAVDLAGASYLKINKPDRAIHYYEHIGKLVDDRLKWPRASKNKLELDTKGLLIWKGIVKGGIAKAYLLQKKYDAAYPLLLQNLESSTNFDQWNDVAGVQNSLAKIDELRGHTPSALHRYSQAYHFALKSNLLPVLVTAAEGTSASFAKLHQYDSAYVYHKRFLHWKEMEENNLNQGRLDIIKSQVDFENMQTTLMQSQNNLVNQKRIRNSILIAIVLLTAITLLLYNRKMLRIKLQNDKLAFEKQRSVTERAYAQRQIDSFIHNIAEKNGLIKDLQDQLIVADNSEINLKLSQYTILTEEDWQKFKLDFETVYPNFLTRLKDKMPQITQGEKRIILLAKLGLSTREMANATGVSPETIRSVSSRMRKKFNINADLYTIAKEI